MIAMLVKELTNIKELKLISDGNLNNEIHSIFACDLLSHVMGHGKENQILITVLNNINVIGVASLLDLSGVIFTHNTKVSEAVKEKANELEIPLFVTPLSTAEVTILLSKSGV